MPPPQASNSQAGCCWRAAMYFVGALLVEGGHRRTGDVQWLAPEYSTLFTREDTHDGKSYMGDAGRVSQCWWTATTPALRFWVRAARWWRSLVVWFCAGLWQPQYAGQQVAGSAGAPGVPPCLQYQYAAGKTRPTLLWRWMPWKRCSTAARRRSASSPATLILPICAASCENGRDGAYRG